VDRALGKDLDSVSIDPAEGPMKYFKEDSGSWSITVKEKRSVSVMYKMEMVLVILYTCYSCNEKKKNPSKEMLMYYHQLTLDQDTIF
jgi:hypothetical protein